MRLLHDGLEWDSGGKRSHLRADKTGLVTEADEYILAFMKFGKATHLAEVLRGRLYMQSVEYFRRLEGDPARSDPHEGLTYCGQPDHMVVDVRQGTEWLRVNGIAGPILVRNGPPMGNLFCLFALKATHADTYSEDQPAELVNTNDLSFGDSVVVFLDADEFLHRVKSATEREGLDLSCGSVEYVNRMEYTGPVGPFRKFSEFAGQSEFRLFTAPESRDPRVLDVGPLEDIAFMCPCSELNSHLRLRWEQD